MEKAFSFLVIVLLTISCNNVDDVVNTSTQNPIDVYVCGAKNVQPCYWKNNTLNLLDYTGFSSSIADTIIVVNNDIHVLGLGRNNILDYTKSLYWKNNILTNLTDSFSTSNDLVYSITGMDIVNNDVYFAGITTDISVTPNTYNLVYWKNGVKTIVTSFSTLNTYESYDNRYGTLKVLNNDVYISGVQENNGVLTYGYYINDDFYPIDKIIMGFNSFNSEVYCFGKYSQLNGFYKNLSTNIETNLATNYPIKKICFDAGNIYATDNISIFENDINIYTTPTPTLPIESSFIGAFYVKNGLTYVLTTDYSFSPIFNLTNKLLVNNVITMQNSSDETFRNIFID
jgi:hypothetical protein